MIDALQCLAESARVVTLTIIDEEQRMPFEYGMLHAIAAMRELRWLSAEFTVSIECAFMNTVNASPLSALSQLQHAELRFSFNDCESAYQAPVTSAVDTLQWDGAPSLHTLIVWGAYEVRLSGFPSLRRAMHWQHQGWGKDGPATAVEPRGGAVDLTPLRETGSLCHTEDPWES